MLKNIFKKHNNIENNIIEEHIDKEHIIEEFKPTAESMMRQFDEATKEFADKLYVAANTFERNLRKMGFYCMVSEDYEKLKKAHGELVEILFEMEDNLAAKLDKGNE